MNLNYKANLNEKIWPMSERVRAREREREILRFYKIFKQLNSFV